MLKNIAPKAGTKAVRKARQLRRQMTLPEVLLWRVLRSRPGGLKFRRQHGSGDYVLDFFCSDARLAVEVDGRPHNMGERPRHDEVRDAWFADAGIETLRIAARQVLNDLDGVAGQIVAAALSRLPLHHPAAPGGPPPRDEFGED